MPRLSRTHRGYNTPQNARTGHVISSESACCYDNVPLHSAVKEDNAEKLEYLLGIPNIDLNYRSEVTALYLSLQLLRSDSFIIRLIEAGCDPNITTVNNDAPLHIAVNRLTTKVAVKLIEKGADVNAVDGGGQIPLHYAVENNNLESVCMLLYYGANVNFEDVNNETPFDIALKYESLEIISVLIGYYDSSALVEPVTMQRHPFTYVKLNLLYYLVNAGANVNYMDFEGNNLLLHSIYESNDELFKFIWSKFDLTILINCKAPFLRNYICHCEFPPMQWLECLYLILESPNASNLIDCFPIFDDLVEAFCSRKIERKDRMAIIYLFLRLDWCIDDECYKIVYEVYGFQEELEALIYCSSTNLKNYEPADYSDFPLIIKTLNFELDREDIFEWCKYEIENFGSDGDETMMKEIARTLGFFWLPARMKAKLVDLFEGRCKIWGDVSKILNERGTVPSLCELSRKQSRRYIRENFNIERSYQFYDVLKKLKLPRVIYDIICFHKPLY